MPQYTAKQNIKSGLPLGGIGAGKCEIFPSGVLDNFTFLNNISKPLTNSTENDFSGVLGYHFALFCSFGKSKVAKLLQTVEIADYPTVDEIAFEGSFPFAYLDYRDSQIPLKVRLKAYSFFTPQREKDSCMPSCMFEFTLVNPTNRPVEGSLLFNVRNIVGQWCVGRFNQVIEDSDMVDLNMLIKRPASLDLSQGNMSAAIFKSKNYEISFLGEYNLAPKPFCFNKRDMRLEAFEVFSKNGKLPDVNSEIPVNSESVELGGALAAKFVLKSKGRITIPVALAWNFPLCQDGHAYSNYFRSSREAVRYVHLNNKQLHASTESFVKEVKNLPVPLWLQDALLNNLYTFFSSTIWAKNMKFAFIESPEMCPLAGTLDVRFYSSLAVALLFPHLEMNEIKQFADMQRPHGYIPHDLGRLRMDMPSISTNRLFWKDLNSKFILMIYRDYLWTKDREFLKKMFVFVKKAFYWLSSTDKNKDFLPDNEGQDHTFDLWQHFGASSYTSSLFLAGMLALIKICDILEDKETKKSATEYFNKGKKSFEKKLWHKDYFIEYNNRGSRAVDGLPRISDACSAVQLTGQWYAHLLGLGYIAPKVKVKKAIEKILKLNAQDSPYGITNSVYPSRERNRACIHSENIWIGASYAFLSLAIYEGFEKEALDLGQRMWQNICENQLNAWNQPDIYSSSHGNYLFGDHYMRNLCVWSLLFAMAQKNKKIKVFLDNFIRTEDNDKQY